MGWKIPKALGMVATSQGGPSLLSCTVYMPGSDFLRGLGGDVRSPTFAFFFIILLFRRGTGDVSPAPAPPKRLELFVYRANVRGAALDKL